MEVFIPSSNLSCSLPSLPQDRYYHTIDGLYICGGEGAIANNCLHFMSGQWTSSYTMVRMRRGHTSWMTDQGLVLMGGYDSADSEMVPTDGGEGGPAFNLKYSTR